MPAFPGVDFLDFDSLLNDEELLARKTARQFVDEQVLPIIVKHNRDGTFPLELVPQSGGSIKPKSREKLYNFFPAGAG